MPICRSHGCIRRTPADAAHCCAPCAAGRALHAVGCEAEYVGVPPAFDQRIREAILDLRGLCDPDGPWPAWAAAWLDGRMAAGIPELEKVPGWEAAYCRLGKVGYPSLTSSELRTLCYGYAGTCIRLVAECAQQLGSSQGPEVPDWVRNPFDDEFRKRVARARWCFEEASTPAAMTREREAVESERRDAEILAAMRKQSAAAASDLLALLYHEARWARRAVAPDDVDRWERVAALGEDEFEAWRAVDAVRRDACSAGDVEGVFRKYAERLGVTVGDLHSLFHLPYWYERTRMWAWLSTDVGLVGSFDSVESVSELFSRPFEVDEKIRGRRRPLVTLRQRIADLDAALRTLR